MDNVLHKTANVTVALSKVKWAQLGRRLVQARVSSENTTALTLSTDNCVMLVLCSYLVRCARRDRTDTYRVPWS